MTINSAIPSTRLLTVRAEHDDKAQRHWQQKDGKKKPPQDDPTGQHLVVNEQGQTTGKIIDITA